MTWLPDLHGRTRRAIARGAEVRRAPVPLDLRRRDGTVGGRPARIEVDAWTGPVLGWARNVRLASEPHVRVLSVLILPDPRYDLPLFGSEVVEVRGAVTVVAIDWIPAGVGGRHVGPLAAIGDRAGLPPAGDLPAWAADAFSPHAIFSRPRGAVGIDVVVRSHLEALHGYLRLCAATEPAGDPRATSRAHRAYCDAHRRHDPGAGMLRAGFGAAWTERFAREVLFRTPDPEPR